MNVKEYLESTYTGKDHNIRRRIICKDGFSISVQGGTTGHYCHPRECCNIYQEVECGYPSAVEKTLMPYQDGTGNPLESVYGYVPIEIIDEIIKKHGGI